MPQGTTLLECNPSLAAQWHPIKNEGLTPDKITKSSGKKVWWICEKNHEWQASVANRNNGNSCPYCTSRRLLSGYNDLASQNPDLASQWHPTKNGNLTPDQIMKKSGKKVWWLCPECGHEWKTQISIRANGAACPKCGPKHKTESLINKRGSLRDNNPVIAAQWHPNKNGDLTSDQVTKSSKRKVWWLCPDCGYEWQATVGQRSRRKKCPNCSDKKRKIKPKPRRYQVQTNNSISSH